MALKTETVSTFDSIDGIEVRIRTVDEDEDYSGVVVVEFDGNELVLSEDDVEDLRSALNETGF